jgi:hypothetical protein
VANIGRANAAHIVNIKNRSKVAGSFKLISPGLFPATVIAFPTSNDCKK